MGRKFLVPVIAVLLASMPLFHVPGFAAANETSSTRSLSIATVDNRPLSIDRLLFEALGEMGVRTDITTTASLQQGYILANNGERNAVISSTPDMESIYPNLVKVPVPLEYMNVSVFLKEGSRFEINTWDDLAELRVGILTQRVYIENAMPKRSKVTVKETTKQLFDGLQRSEFHAVVLSTRANETVIMPDGIALEGVIETLPEYLYLHKSLEDLVDPITEAIGTVLADGRGEKILRDIPIRTEERQKTILHIISSNAEIVREEEFSAQMKENFKNDISIEWYPVTFDTIRFSDSLNRLSYFANLLRRDCVSRNVVSIVVSGEDALEFIKEHYFLFFRNVPVIFYGVGEEYAADLKDYAPYFTGIVEKPEMYETVSAALELFPDTKNLYVINGFATEGRKYKKTFEKQLQAFNGLNISYNEDMSHEEMRAQIAGLPADSLVMVGSYFLDSKGHYYSQREMRSFFEQNCHVPVISMYSTDLPYASVGGKTLDYKKYGTVVSGMLEDILAGKTVSEIPTLSNSESLSRWVFNKEKLDQWQISEWDLPKDAEVINKRRSILESNPEFAFSMVVIFFLLFAIISAMFQFLSRYRKQNMALIEAKKDLHSAEELLAKDEKIKEVKERLERVINNSPISYMLTLDNKVVEINENMKKDTGLGAGDDPNEMYADSGYRAGVLERLRQGQTVKNEITRIKHKGGGIHRSIVNFTDVDYDNRKALTAWFVDVEQAEREKDRIQTAWRNLRSIIDTMPVPACIVDIEDSQIVYGNNSYLLLMKADSQDVFTGMNPINTLSAIQSSGAAPAELVQMLLHATGPISVEAQMRNRKDEIIETRIITCPIEYNDREAVFSILMDLTEEKERQRMLRNAAEKQKEANELKSSFLVNMSHEIRTPMNAIIGLTEIELRKKQTTKVRDIYKKINSAAQNLLHIINDILDMSKIEANKMDLLNEEFTLEEVLDNAMLVATPRLEGKNVELMLNVELDLPRFLIGDKTRLWQILKNFLDNSAKFTNEGKILLTAAVDKKYSNDKVVSITFVVKDTGIGLSEEQLEKIFLPYEQFYSEAQKKYSGTGLGMSISKQFCELMGGTMSIDSTVDVGTTIKFTIPFGRSDKTETELQAVSSEHLKDINILAVDNDETALEIMEDLLKGTGANYVLAGSGAEAMDIIYSYRNMGIDFDLILLDYMMEGIDGIETAKEIQSNLSRSPKLLMVTAYQRELVADELKSSGISDIIEKPFVPTKFIQRLCSAMGFGTGTEEKKEVFTKFAGVKVLLFEDSPLNQEVAAGMFAQFGIVPLMVSNGKQGVEILEKTQDFDLIFMDLQMPVMDGHEATRVIRADSRCDNIPIISLSASAMREVIDKCIQDGMDDHVAKPIEFAALHRVLLKWLPESKRIAETFQIKARSKSQPADSYEEALERFGGNKEFYDRATADFAQSLPAEWPDFESAVRDKDSTLREIHGIKGLAGTLGIKNMYQGVINFESCLRADKPNEELYRNMVGICAEFRTNNMLRPDAADEAPTETGSSEEFEELMNRLEEALDDYDPLATSEIAQLLKKKTRQISAEDLEKICAPALNYDFKTALEALNAVREKLK